MTFRQTIATRLARLLTAGGAMAVLLLPAFLAAHNAVAHTPAAHAPHDAVATVSTAASSQGEWPDEAPRHGKVRCDLCIAYGSLHVTPVVASPQPVLVAPEAERLVPIDVVVGAAERLILCRPRAPPAA